MPSPSVVNTRHRPCCVAGFGACDCGSTNLYPGSVITALLSTFAASMVADDKGNTPLAKMALWISLP